MAPVVLLLLQVSLIVALSRVMGLLFSKIRQPQVIGEMIAGIMLGPSLFGLFWPELQAAVFPPASRELIQSLSQFGVLFFLFLVGLELDPRLLMSRGRVAAAVSVTSIALPFMMGVALAVVMIRMGVFGERGEERMLASSLFMGAAMSVTAFPVLARILTERNLHKTKVGMITIACAAIDDVSAWVILAFVVAVANSDGPSVAAKTAILAMIYVAFMFLAVRPFLKRMQLVFERQDRLPQWLLAVIFVMVLLSAYVAEEIGIHALFGAFLAGFIMPKGTTFVRHLTEKLEDFTVVLLLPLFFANAGLQTKLDLIVGAPILWLFTALIIVVACAGKFGGSMIAARLFGTPWREAAAMGILMNTRGLMELVILTAGLQLGVINEAVYAMMVVMALVTTFMATPLLYLVFPRTRDMGWLPSEGKPPEFSVLIPVADPKSAGPLLQLAHAIAGPSAEGPVIYALHLSRPTDSDAYRASAGVTSFEHARPLKLLMEHAEKHKIAVEPLSFISRDVAAGVARVARDRHASLVLMGFHKPVFGATILGGTVHRVLTGVDSDVAVFVDRGFLGARKILVPYLGGPHDRLALRLARRIARNVDAEVTILQVGHAAGQVKPVPEPTETEAAGEKAKALTIHYRVVDNQSPVEAVIQEAHDHDLVAIGVSEEWGLESHLFGMKPERVAAQSRCSLLIVRRHEKVMPVSLQPPASTVAAVSQSAVTLPATS